MPRFNNRSRIISVSKGHKEWQPFGAAMQTVPAISAIAALIVMNVAGTILRTRGRISFTIDGPVANDACIVSWGIMIADDDRVAAGATAFPDPGDDSTVGKWFAYGVAPLISAGAVEDTGNNALSYEFDSKAMRKFGQAASCSPLR